MPIFGSLTLDISRIAPNNNIVNAFWVPDAC